MCLKYIRGVCCQKWVWSQNSKIGCISVRKLKLLEKFRKAKNYFNNFWSRSKMGDGILLGHGNLKYVPSQD